MTGKIETARLILRPFQRDDLSHMQRYATRPAFYRYLPIQEQTPETVADFLEIRIAIQESPLGTNYAYALELKEVGHIVGSVRLGKAETENGSGDLGFALDSDYQGRGLMTEAVQAMLCRGFTNMGLHRIRATADVENTASWRLMERVGMSREEGVSHGRNMRGEWREAYVYMILESEFRQPEYRQ